MKALDIYYKRPILYDYLLSILIIIGFLTLEHKYHLYCIDVEKSASLSSDLGAIGLTISGFVLTLSTILITLKTNQILNNKELTNNSSPFEIFLSSPLYLKSIEILKHAVLSLVISSIALYLFKIILPSSKE